MTIRRYRDLREEYATLFSPVKISILETLKNASTVSSIDIVKSLSTSTEFSKTTFARYLGKLVRIGLVENLNLAELARRKRHRLGYRCRLTTKGRRIAREVCGWKDKVNDIFHWLGYNLGSQKPYTEKGILRRLQIIRLLRERGGLSVTEISRELKVDYSYHATVYVYLNSMRCIARHGERYYFLERPRAANHDSYENFKRWLEHVDFYTGKNRIMRGQ